MGNSHPRGEREGGGHAVVSLKTSDVKNAPGDTQCFFKIHGEAGSSEELVLFPSSLAPGKVEILPIPGLQLAGDWNSYLMEFWVHTNEPETLQWFIEAVTVTDSRGKSTKIVFPLCRWIMPGHHYIIMAFETALPQFINTPACIELRKEELEMVSQMYQIDHHYPNFPPQLALGCNIPHQEFFSDTLSRSLNDMVEELKGVCTWLNEVNLDEPWEVIEQFSDFYNDAQGLPTPLAVLDWITDSKFGHQRLCGLNPFGIRLAKGIPDKMNIDENVILPYLEGWRLAHVIEAKRLYYVDMEFLSGFQMKNGHPLPAPIGLFYRDSSHQLVPLAVQLYQNTGESNPVFTPDDPSYLWLTVKMWFNMCDSLLGFAMNYFVLGHLIPEGVAIAVNKFLSPSHPVYKLLYQHTRDIFVVNRSIMTDLLEPSGFIDRCTCLTSDTFQQLVARIYHYTTIKEHLSLPSALHYNGTSAAQALPNFYWRDDAIRIYSHIERYVSRCSGIFYRDYASVQHDNELQGFINFLTTPSPVGLGLKGVQIPVSRPNDVAGLLTSIVYGMTAGASSSSALLFDTLGFPPAFPLVLHNTPPTMKSQRDLSERDVLEALPNKREALDTILAVRVMSRPPTIPLGQYGIRFWVDNDCQEAYGSFRDGLAAIEAQTPKIVGQRAYPYHFLLPPLVSNYVHI